MWGGGQKTRRNRFGVTSRMKTREESEQTFQNSPGPVQINIVCQTCYKFCKSFAGFNENLNIDQTCQGCSYSCNKSRAMMFVRNGRMPDWLERSQK